MNGLGNQPADGPGAERWERFLDDATAIADEYRDEGWEVLELEPGDVTPVESADHERFGFSVLVPDSEYEAVESWVGDSSGGGSESEGEDRTAAVDTVNVFRHEAGDTVFALAVELDESATEAVAIPIYYRRSQARALLETGLECGQLPVHVRPLSVERWVTFEHDEPSLFVPDGESASETGSVVETETELEDESEPEPSTSSERDEAA